MASTGKTKQNKTTIGKTSFCFCNRPDQPGRVVIYIGVKSIQSICKRTPKDVCGEANVPAATHFSFKTSAEYLTLSIFSSFKDYGIGCVLTEIHLLP